MQKIKVSIADRVYPLNVPHDQEAILRESASQINQMMKHFEKSYEVKDKQDVLAMCALQLAVQANQEADKIAFSKDRVHERLEAINDVLVAALDQ